MWCRIANRGRKHYKIQFNESGSTNTIRATNKNAIIRTENLLWKFLSLEMSGDISAENAPLLHRNCVANAMK